MPQAVTLRDRAAAARPRFVRDAIVLGRSTILARRTVERGCYFVEKPDDDALLMLLSLAYEKRISLDDPMVRAVLGAADVLLKSPERVDSLLAHLPEPAETGLSRLPQAERLLKAGVAPADLEGALRRDRLGLPEAPIYAAQLTLCDKGVVLGRGTVIAATEDSAGGGAELALKGREERILALLSIASGQAIDADVLSKFETASRALKGGNVSLAAILLAQAGLPPLAHAGMVKALTLAAAELDRGIAPFDLLKGLDLLPAGMGYADWLRVWRKEGGGNPNHVGPGCPEGGQFCSADEAGGDTVGNDQQIASGASNNADQAAAPTDGSSGQGKVVRLPDGSAIPDPKSPTGVLVSPTADLSNVAAAGRQTGTTFSMMLNSGSDAATGAAVYLATQLALNLGQGGTFDYQRDGNMITGYTQYPQYRNVSNVNVGLFCQQAGLSLDETLTIAGAYARIRSSNARSDQPYGLDSQTAQFIVVGYHLGESGVFGQTAK